MHRWMDGLQVDNCVPNSLDMDAMDEVWEDTVQSK